MEPADEELQQLTAPPARASTNKARAVVACVALASTALLFAATNTTKTKVSPAVLAAREIVKNQIAARDPAPGAGPHGPGDADTAQRSREWEGQEGHDRSRGETEAEELDRRHGEWEGQEGHHRSRGESEGEQVQQTGAELDGEDHALPQDDRDLPYSPCADRAVPYGEARDPPLSH